MIKELTESGDNERHLVSFSTVIMYYLINDKITRASTFDVSSQKFCIFTTARTILQIKRNTQSNRTD